MVPSTLPNDRGEDRPSTAPPAGVAPILTKGRVRTKRAVSQLAWNRGYGVPLPGTGPSTGGVHIVSRTAGARTRPLRDEIPEGPACRPAAGVAYDQPPIIGGAC